MTELIIPPSLIDKLGHNISEIRERALISLLSKIDNGYRFENNLAQSKNMLTKLFEWFLFDPCPHEEMVLALIKRILLTDSGSILINHYGPNTIKKELKQVKDCVEPHYQSLVQDLFDIVDAFKEQEVVPPLVSDVPLSYRSGQSSRTKSANDRTATSFGGYISKGPSVEMEGGNPKETFTVERNSKSSPPIHPNVDDLLPNYVFRWQPLIEADRQVLNTLENSLRNPPQPSELLHSCEFFTDVLLHDFPAEVFLQRPTIVLLLQDILLCTLSTRVSASVLNCLTHLTKALVQRIGHCNDPCLRCLKEYKPSSVICSPSNSQTQSSIGEIEFKEDYKSLKECEISTTKYCLTTLKCILDYLIIKPESLRDTAKKKYTNLYKGMILIEHLLYLLKRCFCCEIFNVQPIGTSYEILKELNQCLICFGDLMENYRIEVNTNEINAKLRAIQICILHHCMYFLENFIPSERSIHLLPKCLKNSLTMSLLDIPIAKLYPKLHQDILNYVQTFSKSKESENLEKFHIVNDVCESMSASVELMRNHDVYCFSKLIGLAKNGILSLQFHENLAFVRIAVETCATKFNLHTNEEDALIMEDVLLSLLSHHIEEVVEYTYELCYKKVITAIGPMLNFNGYGVSSNQVVFLLRPKILTEIAQFGLSNKNKQVQKYAEDIVIHFLKCKILVTDDIWDKVRAGIIPSFPVLLVYASKINPLGRTLVNVVDPDIAKDLRLPIIEVIKSNILLMYSPEDLVRDEAFSRLCWLLAQQENSKELLPRLNNVNDKILSNICQISPAVFDVNKSKSSERFYQPSSLHNVLELLNSTNVEPGIRRSALTQISVMMEDYLLHDIFIEKGGVETIMKIMNNALIEEDYTNYADSVIPSVSILKSICLYDSKVRYELSHNLNLFYFILRGMFLFCTEERMRIDSSVLLFLLLYSSFLRGSPSRSNMAIPKVVHDKLATPIRCEIYGKTSDYTDCDITELILSDKTCLTSIQIHWNSEVYGGFQKLTELQNFTEPQDIKITDQLKMQTKDLVQIKVSCIEFSIGECLKEMERGECYANYQEILSALIIYVYLYRLWKKNDEGFILKYPWEEQFGKFLRILPSSEDDVVLLQSVINFLRELVPFYKSTGKSSWISSIIKDPTQYLTDMIDIDHNSDEHAKILSRSLVGLVTDCACQEQHFIDFYIESDPESTPSDDWSAVIEMVTDNLKLQDPQQLYNLGHLDSLLSCLVHLSAMLGWSKARRKSCSKETMKDIISGLCDLVDAFHYGKGPSAAVSLMGLSITRNVMLILNHILAEIHHSETKNWDLLFVEDVNQQNKIFNFIILWETRDVILRAAVLQFFAGLFQSARLARDIVTDLRKKHKCLWSMTLDILLDNEEAALVRENAALIMANLCTHRRIATNGLPSLHSELVALEYNKESHTNPVDSVLEVLEKNGAVKQLKTIILCLYTNNISDVKMQEIPSKSSGYLYTYRSGSDISEKTWSCNSGSTNEQLNLVTPSLMKTTIVFLHNLIEMTGQPYVDYINDGGLIKLIFRSICVPSIEIKNTRELSLYIEILEMNSEICFFLNRAVRFSPGCLGTILHTKDCFNVFISLLNPKMYHTHLPQLVYLRNKVWTEMFNLVGTLLECGCQVEDPKRAFEILAIVLEAVYNCGPMNLVATVCEAIESFGATDLQISVLSALTLMLQVECSYTLIKNHGGNSTMKHSMKDLLDTVKSPSIGQVDENIEIKDPQVTKSQQATKYKMNLLEKLYFGENDEKPILKPIDSTETKSSTTKKKCPVSGVHICKLLLHLYDIYDLKSSKESNQKQIILAATSSILCVSTEAKYYALDTGFLQKIIESLKELSIKLSLESIDCFRRVSDKKRISPMLKDLDCVTGLLTNFLMENVSVKCEAAALGLTDIIHKVWNWFAIQKSALVNVLKMLSTFTTNCPFACQTLPYTSSVAGTGPRKNTSSVSLLHVIVSVVLGEMDMLSKTHEILPLRLCFNILQNCCPVLECRICITKTSLVQGLSKLHPSVSKQQKPWETVELIWLEFLQIFTVYPEGQMYIGKLPDVLDLVISLTQGNRPQNRMIALRVLQNIAFYTPNRARLLTTPNFINTLVTKLENGTTAEKVIVVNTMWALAANNMKAKTVFKSCRLDAKLAEALKKVQLLNDDSLSKDEIERMQYVLDILKDSDRCK
ncbi:rotatin [Coccinella septempunctata]|uniref:rotatin n=1 Tax=Coccinella septempunctata TaxID=41139 RepID=UPI001D07F22A|nr:rotatin [Coccinella septempunctata]